MWEQPFAMIVMLTCIGAVTGLASTWLKQREKGMIGARALEELQQRLDRIEQRMANIETIVLDREKKQEFERVL